MQENDSDSDDDRNEYMNDEIMASDDIGGVYLHNLDRDDEDYDQVSLEYEQKGLPW